MNQGEYKQEYPYCSQAIQTCQMTLSTTAVPKIKMLRQNVRTSSKAQTLCNFGVTLTKCIVFIIVYMDTLSAQIDAWSDICQKWLKII